MPKQLGIIFKDELIFSELIKSINEIFPYLEVKVMSNYVDIHKSNINDSNLVKVGSVKEILETDCLIILCDINSIKDIIKSYRGTIIDFTGYVGNLTEKVIQIEDPLVYILNKLFEDLSDISGNIYLPVAIFGKMGVEELLKQMQDLFNFNTAKDSFYNLNLPFNVIFLDNLDISPIKNYIAYIKERIDADFSYRLLPVMSGIIMDIFSVREPYLNGIEYVDTYNDLVSLVNNKDMSIVKKGVNFYSLTIACDYIKVIVKQITSCLKNLESIDDISR
ncbi:MAG: hypothetical protein SVN78_03285 [Deferribacterota bacterium]|nr:hypothetical protein [Deferribacterota bacterium]